MHFLFLMIEIGKMTGSPDVGTKLRNPDWRCGLCSSVPDRKQFQPKSRRGPHFPAGAPALSPYCKYQIRQTADNQPTGIIFLYFLINTSFHSTLKISVIVFVFLVQSCYIKRSQSAVFWFRRSFPILNVVGSSLLRFEHEDVVENVLPPA